MKNPSFQVSRVSGQPVSDSELLADLCRVAQLLNKTTVSQPQYREHGKYDHTTIARRFGWNKALIAAGLSLSNEVNIPDERLFENLLALWQHYGRQPRRSELAKPPSNISQTPYNRRFGGWTNALKAFVDYANTAEIESPEPKPTGNASARRLTGRDPSLRLRWKILKRDRFTCCKCGKSPATTVGVELHVDHVISWEKGGLTVIENLQTLCSLCNLGKSNE
ncbi:MAG TPA: HNH endonuclease [bacterium]|nr:HNH endonuclease [bacterium]